MEERVHPIPFRTWKLSSPSPMILHNVMWESRPLPTSFKAPRCYSRGELCYFTPRLFLRSAVLIRTAPASPTAKAFPRDRRKSHAPTPAAPLFIRSAAVCSPRPQERQGNALSGTFHAAWLLRRLRLRQRSCGIAAVLIRKALSALTAEAK